MEETAYIEEVQQEPQPDPIPKKKVRVKEFAAKIKEKYPAYKDVDDLELTNKIIAKYPEYKDQVDLSPEIKKKVGSVVFEESSLEAGNSPLQSNGVGGEEIPTIEMYTTPNGEMVEANPIALSKKYNELNNRTTLVSDVEGATALPDEEAQKSAKKLKEDFSGIDLGGIYEETKDIPDDVLANVGKELMQDREQNTPLYQRKLANLKWRNEFENKIIDDVDKDNISPDDYNRIKNSIDKLPEFTGTGDFTNQRTAIKSLANDIQLYGGENKDKILQNFAVEVSKVYGSAYNNNFKKTIEGTPESKYLNEDAQLGIQYLEDVEPDKARQYDRLKVNPKDLEGDALKGYNHLMQTAEETGIGLQQNSVTEELNSLKKQAADNGGLTEEQLAKATELEKKQDELTQKRNELDAKYPERVEDKVDDAMQEILGQKISGMNYVGGTAYKAIKNTAQGIWEAVSTPFMSDASNTMRELGIMGESQEENRLYHKTDKNTALLTDRMVIEPELQTQIDAITNNKVMKESEKEMKLYRLLKDNTDKFGRVPIKGGKWNINGASIAYGLSDLGTTLLPFVALEAATGGGATAGLARKFMTTFTAAAATTFHDEYAAAIQSGSPNPYKEAMGVTAISSLAMAGAGTPQKIKAMVNPRTSSGKLILSMSDDAIQKVLDKGTPKALNAIKNRIKATPAMVKGGLKTGAEFEVAMTAANEAKHQIYDTEIDREANFKHSLLAIGNFGIMGAGLGHIGYKSPTEMQKGAGLLFGAKPKDYISVAEEMRKNGQLTEKEFDHRVDLINQFGDAYKSVPKDLNEKQKAEYLYQTVIKNEATKGKSDLPPKQAAEAEKIALVADYKREIILDEPTDKQLETRKASLEKQLEKKDEEGKLELDEKDRIKVKAEVEAIEDTIENKEVVTPTPTEVKGEKPDILVQVKLDGKEINAKYLDDYKGQKIVEIDGDVYAYNPKTEVLFKVALDDSKTGGNRKVNPEANNVQSAKEYIDWSTKTREENTPPTTIEVKGKDVVVDEGVGKPIKLFHSSKTGIENISDNSLINELGIHLGSKEAADKIDGTTKEYSVDIKNPIEVPDFPRWEAFVVSRKLKNDGIITDAEYDQVNKKTGNDKEKELLKILKSKGYDGFVYENAFEGGGKSYVAFDKKQVKEVTPEQSTQKSKPVDEGVVDKTEVKTKANEKEVTKDTKQATETVSEQQMVDETTQPTGGKKEPPKEPTDTVGEGENLPERKFTKQMLRSDELSDVSKTEIAKTLNYVRQTHEMTLKEANEVIDKVGLNEAQTLVIGDSELKPVVRNAVGMILIKKFNELSEKATEQADKDYYLDKSIQTASAVTERYATEAGQSIEIFKLWSQLSPEGQLRSANQDMARQAKEKLRRREKDIDTIGKKFQKANEEAASEVTKSEKVKKPKPKTATDKISDAQKKREEIKKKYQQDKGKNLYSGVGLTKEGIEYVGEMTATYVQEGVAKLEIIVDRIIKELKALTGKDPDNAVRKNVEYIVKEKISGIEKEKKELGEKEKIEKGLVDMEAEINKIINEHYTVPEEAKKKLVDKFIEKVGLEKSEAEKLAKEVEAEFDKIATRKKRNILYNEKARFDKINKTLGTKDTPKQKTVADEIIKYSNLGAFEGKEFADMIANKFGLGELTPEQAKKLLELANKVKKAPEGSPKNNATEDLLAYRAKLKGNDLGETIQSVWYANVLSGYKTQEKNIVSTFFNSMGELGAQMAKDPKSIPYLIAGYIKGVGTRGLVEAGNTLKTGYSPIHIKKIEVPNALERKSYIGGGINPANWLKYVMRTMIASDVLSFQGLKEARAYQLARKEVASQGFNTWTKKGWDEVNKVLLHTKERWDSAELQVQEEGITGKLEKRRRIYELMEESRPIKMTEDTYGFAAKGTFNHESEGTLGAITNATAQALDTVSIGGVKPARFIVPFTRIITNVVNNSLDYTPVGFIRAARGVRGFRSFEGNRFTKGAFKELTTDERKSYLAKAALGITLAGTFQAMHQAGLIQITGAGTGNSQKDEQLRQTGWQEYSVKVGDKYYSYKFTPLVFMMGYLGNMNDAEKYQDEETTLKQMEVAASRLGGQVADMTWINSAATFLGALTEKNTDQQINGITKSLAGMGRGFVPFAGLVTQTSDIFAENKKQITNTWQTMISSIPIARNFLNDKINALGDPIKVDIDVLKSKETVDPVWKFLLDNNGWVAPVNPNTIIVFDKNTKQDRPITNDEYYEFSKTRGGKIKKALQDKMIEGVFIETTGEGEDEMIDYVKINKMNKKDFNEWLSGVEEQATKDTKFEMFGEKPETPPKKYN